MKLGVTKEDLDRVVGIHPTCSEEFVNLKVTQKSGVNPEKTSCWAWRTSILIWNSRSLIKLAVSRFILHLCITQIKGFFEYANEKKLRRLFQLEFFWSRFMYYFDIAILNIFIAFCSCIYFIIFYNVLVNSK